MPSTRRAHGARLGDGGRDIGRVEGEQDSGGHGRLYSRRGREARYRPAAQLRGGGREVVAAPLVRRRLRRPRSCGLAALMLGDLMALGAGGIRQVPGPAAGLGAGEPDGGRPDEEADHQRHEQSKEGRHGGHPGKRPEAHGQRVAIVDGEDHQDDRQRHGEDVGEAAHRGGGAPVGKDDGPARARAKRQILGGSLSKDAGRFKRPEEREAGVKG